MSRRLAVFTTHPIQYMAPVWRHLARTPGLDLKVHYFSDQSVRGATDPGFGVAVKWDVPILDGYDHVFLTRDGDRDDFRSCRIPDVRRYLRDGHYDWVMVHGYTHPFERQAVRAAKGAGARVLMRGEFTDAPRPGRQRLKTLARDVYLRWFYRHVDAFCYLGENGRAHLLAHGVRPEQMFLSPYAVDTELLESQRERWRRDECRSELGIADNRVVVLFSGKFITRKRPVLLIDAIRRTGRADRIHLILLGSGPLQAEVEAAARDVCGANVTLPGFVNQSELGRYFAAADVFVLPSEFETWGLVVNEAMQFGLPAVVSSTVGCHADLIEPGRTGYVFPSGDAAALADRLTDLLADPAAVARMGREARARVAGFTPAASAAGIRRAIGLTE